MLTRISFGASMNFASLPFSGCLVFLCLLSSVLAHDATSASSSTCVKTCPLPEDVSECRASVEIQSSVSAPSETPALRLIHRSTPLALDASVNLRGKCYESYDVRWTWSAYDARGRPVRLRGVALGASFVEVPPWTLDIGSYVFRANASLTKPSECLTMNPLLDHLEVSGEIPIRVNISKLVVVLMGAWERRVSKTEAFAMDASETYDPDRRLNLSHISFAYSCDTMQNYLHERKIKERYKRQVANLTTIPGPGSGNSTGQAETTTSVVTEGPPAAADSDATTETSDGPTSDPDANTTSDDSFSASTMTADETDLDLDPDIEKVTPTARPSLCRGMHKPFRYSNSSILTFHARDFPPTDKYVFRVYAVVPSGKYEQKACEEQIIEFVDYETGDYDIVCEHNCHPKISSGFGYRMRAECTRCLALGFEWHIQVVNTTAQTSTAMPVKWGIATKYGKKHPELVMYPHEIKHPYMNFSLFSTLGKPLVSKLIPVASTAFRFRCEVWPKEGWELITEFTINCTDLWPPGDGGKWEDVVYFEFGQKVKGTPKKHANNIILRYSSMPWAKKVRLYAGNLRANYKADLWVTLVEKHGVSTTIPIAPVVRPSCVGGACISMKPDCLMKLVTDNKGGTNYFSSLRRMGKHQIAVATAHVVIHMLNREGVRKKPASQLAKTRYGLSRSAEGCRRLLLPAIKQMLYFVGSIFHTPNVNEIIYDTQLHSLEVVDKCSEMLGKQSAETKEFQEVEIKFLAQHACYTLSDIFVSFHTGRTVTMSSKVARPLLHLESTLYHVTETLFNYTAVNDRWKIVATDYFNLQIQKVKLRHLAGTTFGYIPGKLDIQQLGYFRIPAALTASNPTLAALDVSVQLVQFKMNPLLLGVRNPGTRHVTPLFLNIRNLASNKLITNELGPVDIHLTSTGSSRLSRYYGIPVHRVTFEDEDIGFHKVTIPPCKDPQVVMLSVLLTSSAHSVQALMQERLEPRTRNFVNSTTVRILRNDDPGTEGREDVAFHRLTARGKKTDLYAAVLPSKETARKLIRDFARASVRPILLYAPTVLLVKCLHFDPKKGDWSTKDCSVVTDGMTSTDHLHCRCASLSRFSGESDDSLAAQHFRRIDPFDFYLNVPFNMVIVIFLLMLLTIFVLLFLLATYMDTLLSYKLGVTVVEDNDPEFTYAYLVSVSTGSGLGSGTTSVPAVQLHGEREVSAVHALVDSKRSLLRTACTDHFMVTTAAAIKDIETLTLVQKAVQPSPSWTLHRIVVSDLVTDGAWEFYVNERLQCESLDPVKRNLEGAPVVSGDQDRITSVSERIRKRFEDDFIWTSIFLRPPCSPFTSIQRTICVILFIQLAFLINLLLRGLPEHSPRQHIGLHGFRFLLSDFLLGILTAAILLIFVLVFVYLLKSFFSKRIWRVYIDLSNDWLEYAKKGLVIEEEAERQRLLAEAEQRQREKEEQEEALAAKQGPLRPFESFLVSNMPSARVYEVNLEEVAKKLLPSRSLPPEEEKEEEVQQQQQQGSVADQESVTSAASSGRPAPKGKSGRYWYCRGRGLVWVLLVLVIAALFAVLYCLGHWFSETQTVLWIFSSMVGILFCVCLLHPLVLLLVAMALPMKNTLDKDSLRKVGLSNIFDRRQSLIREKGTLKEFRHYLRFLRQQPIYNARDPSQTMPPEEEGKGEERAPGGAKGKTPEGAKEKEKAPDGTKEKAAEGTKGKAPEGTKEKVPEGTKGKTPEGSKEKAPEGTKEKAAEGTKGKIPEGSKAKVEAPEGTKGKTSEGSKEKVNAPGGTTVNAPEGTKGKTSEGSKEKVNVPEGTKGKASEGSKEKVNAPGGTTVKASEITKGKTSEGSKEKEKAPGGTTEKAPEITKGRTPEGNKEKEKAPGGTTEKAPEGTKGKTPEGSKEKEKAPGGTTEKAPEITKGKTPVGAKEKAPEDPEDKEKAKVPGKAPEGTKKTELKKAP